MKPYYENSLGKIYHADCLEILPDLPQVDLVLTDPPYILNSKSAYGGKLNPWTDLCNSAYWFSAWQKECFSILTLRGAVWQFCNWRSFPTIVKSTFDAGNQIESLLIWNKDWIGPGGQKGLRPSYEMIALICNPDFSIKDRGIPDICKFKWSSKKPHGHPAEKPVSLCQWLIDISNANYILDPFMGSGSTLVGAIKLNRKFIGIDQDEKWCELAAKRCESIETGLTPAEQEIDQQLLFGEKDE